MLPMLHTAYRPLALMLLIMVCSVGTLEARGKWIRIAEKDGIVVSQKPIPGRVLPIFRGEAEIESDIFTVVAVMSDTSRTQEWMHNCIEARLLKEINDFERIIYNRTDAPWPVDDRDVVVHTKARIDKKTKTVYVSMRSIKSPLQTEVEGVVRMPTLKGYYIIKAVGDDKTSIVYQVDADPGGLLPKWLVKAASKDLPYLTLFNLRQQVERTRGQYDDKVAYYKQLYEKMK